MKVSDFIAKYLLEHDITQVFCVTGGYAMHLNDSFGRNQKVMYNTGEINCGYAALGWASVDKKIPSVVCTTSGCGATNAITPCLSAWQDSVPVLFISGGVPRDENLTQFNNSVRTFSLSDADIITMTKTITKFSKEVRDPADIGNIMEEAYWNLMNGRKGPVWISIPIDVQNMETDGIVNWHPINNAISSSQIIPLDESKRPVFIIGNGMRECIDEFIEYARRTGVPYVCTYHTIDVPGCVGRVGINGDRNGNTIVQQSDMVIALGCRLGRGVIGYTGICNFAPKARIFQVDIDTSEFNKTRVEYIQSDCIDLIKKLPEVRVKPWFNIFPIERNNFENDNPYTILDKFFRDKPSGTNVVFSSGCLQALTWHTAVPKKDDRIIVCSHGDMGYEIPASIGVAMKTGRRTYCMIGDGSFQFTIGELMHLKNNNLPISILCFDNNGYGSIKITQSRYFKDGQFGNSFNFPSFKKIAEVYDIPYYTDFVDINEGPCIIHLICQTQGRYPMVSGNLDNFV
jgi:acetolactate synthase-1/2/3 large subunit